MANRGYEYQYDTNPRKIKPEYNTQRRNSQTSKSRVSKKTTSKKTTTQGKKKTPNRKSQKQEKIQKRLIARTKFSVFIKCVLLFAIIFFILFRSAQISELFSNIQKLKTEISALQKENDQIEINIQNSMNTNNLEQQAKTLLGMQKLTSKQIVYINIPKKDYVEYKTEEIILDEEPNFWNKLLEKINEVF